MAYKIAAGDPCWELSLQEFEQRAAQFFKNNSVVDDAGRATLVAGLTAPQQLAAIGALLNCFHVVNRP